MIQNTKSPKPKILIIDDEPGFVDLLHTALSRRGFEVVTASNGWEGLEALHRHVPQLIILDIAMPQMNGLEFYGRLQKAENTVSWPTFVVSSRDKLADVFEDAGVIDFVEKPIHIENFCQKVEDFFLKLDDYGRATPAKAAKQVLLVEHDADRALAILQFFVGAGHKVKLVSGAHEAIDGILSHRPDIALIQCDLPEISGKKVAQILRETPSTAEIPVLLYTTRQAHADTSDVTVSDDPEVLLRAAESVLGVVRV